MKEQHGSSPATAGSCMLVCTLAIQISRSGQDTLFMSEPTADHILQVGLGFWASKTLLSAIEMELFTELARHPEALEPLSARLALHPRSARDFLDALVALGFLERR